MNRHQFLFRLPFPTSFLLAVVLFFPNFLSAQQPLLSQTSVARTADSLSKIGQSDAAFQLLTAEKVNAASQTDEQQAAVEFALAQFFYKKREFKNAEPLLQSLVARLERTMPERTADRIAALKLLANTFGHRGWMRQSQQLFEQALEVARATFGEISYEVGKTYSEISMVLGPQGEFEKAIDFGRKAIRTLQAAGLTDHPDFGGFHHNLGMAFYLQNDFANAMPLFEVAFEHLQKRLGDSPSAAVSLSLIGTVYADWGDGPRALDYQLRATEMCRRTGSPDEPRLPMLYFVTATAYNRCGQRANALEFINRAMYAGAKKPRLSPEFCLNASGIHLSLGNFDRAAAYADTSLQLLHFTELRSFHEMPDRDLVWYSLHAKVAAMVADFQKNKNPADLEAAERLLTEANEVIFSLIGELDSGRDKMVFYQTAVKGFAKTIAVETDLWQATGDPRWLRAAFGHSENSKSLLLFQQILENKNRRVAACSAADLAERDAGLRQEIVALEKQIFEQQQPSGGAVATVSASIQNLQEQIFQLKNEQAALRPQIEAACPEYFAAAAKFPKIELSEIQSRLAADAGLLEFFTADSTVFAFLVRRDTLIFRKISLGFSLEKKVGDLRESIVRYFVADEKTSEIYLQSAADYSVAAFELHEKLLEPFADLLPARLTVVPDGVLNYVPFEALLTERPARVDRFQQHSYFSKKHSVAYSYSAALLREMENLTSAAPAEDFGKMLALAPFFDGSTGWQDSLVAMRRDPRRAGLQPLPFSGEEVFRVSKLAGGEARTGATEASKSFFLKNAGRFRVLHLATHGKANDRAGDFSYLAFDTTLAGRLYVSEISGLRLSAELVTLSACETGLGQLHRGEGMVSIARAFASAGARSIVQTQWVVSDGQTRHLMSFFYENLKKGMAKDLALTEARRQYLAGFRGEEAHPYFWAGFIFIGDSRAIR